jgi:hypothetical protein
MRVGNVGGPQATRSTAEIRMSIKETSDPALRQDAGIENVTTSVTKDKRMDRYLFLACLSDY